MKKNNIIFAIINLSIALIAIIMLILALVLPNVRTPFIIIALVSVVIFVILSVLIVNSMRKRRKDEKEFILEGLDKYRHNQQVIVKNLENPDLDDIANAVSDLSILGRSLRNKYVYNMKDFLSYVDNHIDYNDLTNLAYIYMQREVPIKELLDKYDVVYMNKEEVGFSIMVVNFADKKALENIVRLYVRNNNHVSIIYYPDYSILDFIWLDRLKPTYNGDYLKIYDKEENQFKLNNYYALVNEVTLKDDKSGISIEEFITKSMRFLPFSNIVIKVNGEQEFYKWSDKENFNDHKQEEYEFYKDVTLYQKDGNRLSIVLAAYKDLSYLSNDQQLILDSFLNTILVLYLPKFLHTLDKETEKRIYRNMQNVRGYSYVIDKDYNIISASDNLKNKYKEDLNGKKCYKVLFDRAEPCVNCPRMNENCLKHMPSIGTNTYEFSSVDNGKETQISFVEKNSKVLNKKALQETLLDQINNERHGYVMVFKIDYLTDLALKHKVEKEQIVSELVDILSSYSLDGSLYRKEIDEFAYVLENARYAECIEIAKKLSFAFEDKISLEDNGVLLTPKIILLSYPLEINSLFALDSLSRTLFRQADKRGKLYRLAIDPVYVNRKREYLEIIEQSLKDDKIPVSYREFVNKDSGEVIKDVRFNYLDKDNNPIKEETITLYAKLEGFYFPMLERVVKSVPYDNEFKYAFYFGKEAMDNSLFATVVSTLNAMKIPLNRVIIISEELYFFNHKDILEKYGEMGLGFGLTNIESNIDYSLPVKVKFARVNKDKYFSNKKYARKVLAIHKLGIPLLSHEEIEGLPTQYSE